MLELHECHMHSLGHFIGFKLYLKFSFKPVPYNFGLKLCSVLNTASEETIGINFEYTLNSNITLHF